MATGDPATPVAVIGGGSWGTALSILLAGKGLQVRLWDSNHEHVTGMRRDRENSRHLTGIRFPGGLDPVTDLVDALDGAGDVLVAVPSHAFRPALMGLRPLLDDRSIAWATKGLEPSTGMLLHQVAGEVVGDLPKAVISGPSFAKEVARGLPTAVTVASTSPEHASRWAGLLHSEHFRAYTSDDVVGVEIGGACKNVLAIAAGICDGLKFGTNARSALITRGLAEMMRFGQAIGGRAETFMGLCGLGDLILTCTDDQSRNRRMGLALARGLSVAQARAEIGQAVEGVETARTVHARAREQGVDMPITEQTYRVLFEDLPPREAVHSLLVREQRAEID